MEPVSLNISYASGRQSSPLIGLTTHQLLEKRVHEHPDREMYVFPEDDERISFKAFKDRVEILAAGLLSIGLKKGDRLAIWCNIHMEFPLFVAAARAIGVITVRIRPTFPNITVKDILLRTGCKVIVLGRSPTNLYDRIIDIRTTSAEDVTRIPHLDAIIGVGDTNKSGTYSVDDIEKLGSDPKFSELFKLRKKEVLFDDDSDIFSTSGSTGPPKYVVHTHFSLINGVKSAFTYYLEDIPDKDNRRILSCNSNYISGEAGGVMPPLVAGMTSVFAPSVYDIKRSLQTIQDERCTDAHFSITSLYDICNFKDIDEYDISSLTVCLAGGQSIPPKLVKDLESKIGCTILINYGSTEMVGSAMNPPWDPFETRCSGGRILPNAEVQVVDENGKCVPVGSVGEVWCRCCGNFQRYLGNEEQTKAAKSPHGWFKTGDLGVFNAAGILAIVGRKKDIISRSGVNVFPGDIEKVLSLHPSVDQVQVIGVPDERLGEEICICVRTKRNASIDKDQIVAYLTGKVRDDESIPGYVLIFDCFPKMDTGKIDRKGLAQQAIHRLENEMSV